MFEQVVQRGFPTEVTSVLVKALPEQRDPKAWWGRGPLRRGRGGG